MQLNLDIETPDLWLAFDLIGEGRSLGTGTIVPIPGRARLQLREIRESASGEPRYVLAFALFFHLGAPGEFVGRWLYKAMKDRVATVRLDGVSVPISPGTFERALAARIQQTEFEAVLSGRAA